MEAPHPKPGSRFKSRRRWQDMRRARLYILLDGRRRASLWLSLALLMSARAALGGTTIVSDDAALRRALASAVPGTTILLAPGRYRGGLSSESLRGRPDAPIVLRGADPDHRPVISGGYEGIKLGSPRHVVLRDLILDAAAENGLNIDDRGDPANPATDLTLRGLLVRGSGRHSNQDPIKCSGVVSLRIEDCEVRDWAEDGQGIDLVGCRQVTIRGCRIDGRGRAAVGISLKGGTEDVVVEHCRVRGTRERCVNIGGQTGLQFFRPRTGQFEARRVAVRECEFVGGTAAIAYINSDEATVEDCLIVRPTGWVFRVLREQTDPSFLPTRAGRFLRNVVVWRSDELRLFVDARSGTAPETFVVNGNAWFCIDRPAQSHPVGLPVGEHGGVYGLDPLLSGDADSGFSSARGIDELRRVAALRGRGTIDPSVAGIISGAASLALGLLMRPRRNASLQSSVADKLTETRALAVIALAVWCAGIAAWQCHQFVPRTVDAGALERHLNPTSWKYAAIMRLGAVGESASYVPVGNLFSVLLGCGRQNGWRCLVRSAAALGLVLLTAQGTSFLTGGGDAAPPEYDLRRAATGGLIGLTFPPIWTFAAGRFGWTGSSGVRLRPAAAVPAIYIIALVAAAWWPFEFSLNPVGLYHKFNGGLVCIAPSEGRNGLDCSAFLLAAAAAGSLIASTLPDERRLRWPTRIACSVLFGTLLELGQFACYPRQCAATDWALVTVGTLAGSAAASCLARRRPAQRERSVSSAARRVIGVAAFAASVAGMTYFATRRWLL